MTQYEVALWIHFQGGPEMPVWDEIEAKSALQAITRLMGRHQVRHVSHAAVRLLPEGFLPAGPIERWRMGHGSWIRLEGR